MKNDNCRWNRSGLKRAQAYEFLTPRLEVNKKCQSKDFQSWLQDKLSILPGEKILDLACGEGIQSIYFAGRVGKNGLVHSVDINDDSLKALKEKSQGFNNLSIQNSDMMNVSEYIRNDLRHKITLAHCSFALPYADSPLELLTDLSLQLNPTLGRIAVSLPVSPHEMVQYCAETHEIPQSVLNSISFGESKVIGHMRNLFGEVDVHYFNNELIFSNLVDFKTIYSNSTYFDESNADKIYECVRKDIDNLGHLRFRKGAILIIGSDLLV